MSEKTAQQLQDELAAAQELIEALREAKEQAYAEANKAKEEAAAAEKAMSQAGVLKPVTGSYKGYEFDRNHRRVRSQGGKICDSQMLLDAAQKGDEEACAILDWLIKINYAHFQKPAPADKQADAKQAKKVK